MSEERTEAATPKRREEVRKKGQTSRSQDLTSATVLLAGLYGIKMLAVSMQGHFTNLLMGSFQAAGQVDTSAPPASGGAFDVLGEIFPPLLGMMALAAVVISVVQGGFLFAPGLLSPKFERVNPLSGVKKVISIQGLMQLGKSLAKVAAVSLVATVTIRAHLHEIATLGTLELMPAVKVLIGLLWTILFRSALTLVALGAADWLWERRRFVQSTRMTKQEVKEENRQSEGDPHVRAQIKGKRAQFFQQMMKSVPTASVVITNPTHFAVALKYDPATMAAPVVVAKGQDHLALRIRETAKEAGVPILENKPLARALYKLVQIGSPIPAELYVAVAEVLAFVFRLKGERRAG